MLCLAVMLALIFTMIWAVPSKTEVIYIYISRRPRTYNIPVYSFMLLQQQMTSLARPDDMMTTLMDIIRYAYNITSITNK